MKRVLVTGASGFLGRACVRTLSARGYEVHGTGRFARPAWAAGITWHEADLLTDAGRDRVMTAVQPGLLVHMAWEARPGFYRDSPDNPAWTVASLDLLRRALASGTERIVGIGSCVEYGPFSGLCVESATPCRPTTLYGRAKLAAAEGFAAAADAGASVAWARVFFVFGPGEPQARLIPALIRSLSAGETFGCSHGAQLRDFIYVEDLAEAVLAVLESSLVGCVNVGSGEPRSLRDIVTFFAHRLDGEERIRFGARAVTGVDAEPEITADISRLRRATGWVPVIGWEAGAERTLAWWRSRLEGLG